MRIIDISDPANPQTVEQWYTQDYARAVYVSGGYAYVATGSDGLRVIDVSIPSNPGEAGYYETSGYARGVHVVGGYAYVADDQGGLYILRYTGAPDDGTPPSAVSNLSATPSHTTGNAIDLEWTAPGDDEDTGIASSYTVRYNTVPITESNWNASSDVDGEPVPDPAGSTESMTVTVPHPGVIYYFAIKTQDEVPNTSGISNRPGARSPIQLYNGWNMVAFMHSDPIPVTTAMSCISGKYASVWRYDTFSHGWLRYIIGAPPFLNNLEEMGPGYGYWIQVTEDCVWDFGGVVSTAPGLKNQMPPFLLYGKLKVGEYTATANDNQNISLELGDKEVVSYELGTKPRYGDHYVLEVPVDDSIHEGDIAQLHVDGMLTDRIDVGGMGTVRRHDISYARLPRSTRLLQNYPNPFNPDTWIPYQLAEDSDIIIRIYNVSGRLVRTLDLGHRSAGFYIGKHGAAYWNGKNEVGEEVSSGLYFYTIQAADFTATKKMTISK